MSDWGSSGILGGPIEDRAKAKALWPQIEAKKGMTVLHRGSSFRGVIVRFEGNAVVLKSSASGHERLFKLNEGGFAVNGETVSLVKPKPGTKAPGATASGSVAVATKAKIAKAARIWVEGIHDAELIEKVWGDDLRHCGIVVEPLGGIDNLADAVRTFGPTKGARLGVLVDHLVPHSKEQRIADTVKDANVLITGHPYVDVWQGIRPKALGIEAWPVIPKGTDWKTGICQAFKVDEPPRLWKKILNQVNSYADLEPDLVGAVEQLIDFVTEPAD